MADLFGNLPPPTITNSSETYYFESDQLQMYEQGIVVYLTELTNKTYKFTMVIHDFALVYLDDKLVGIYDRSIKSSWEFEVVWERECKMVVVV